MNVSNYLQVLQEELALLESSIRRLESDEQAPDETLSAETLMLSQRITWLKEEIERVSSPSSSPFISPDNTHAAPDAPDTSAEPSLSDTEFAQFSDTPQTSSCSDSSQTHPSETAQIPYMSSVLGASHTGPLEFSPAPRKSRFLEDGIGKCFAGVLAAVLILLAAGMAANAVGVYIPNWVKFMTLWVAGGVCGGVGWKQMRKEQNSQEDEVERVQEDKRMSLFWMGVTWLGAAMVYLALVFGSLWWSLFPVAAAGIILMLWFMLNFGLSYSADSNAFFVATYIGGIIAIRFAHEGMPGGEESEIIFSIIAIGIYLIGKLGSVVMEKPVLPVLNMCVLLAAIATIRTELMETFVMHSDESLTINHIYTRMPTILVAVELFCAAALLVESSRAWKRTWVCPKAGTVLIPFLAAIVGFDVCKDFVRFALIIEPAKAVAAAGMLFLVMTALIGILSGKEWKSYLLGVSPVSAIAMAGVSYYHSQCAYIFPAVMAFLLIAIPEVKHIGLVYYLVGLDCLISTQFGNEPGWAMYVGSALMMAVPALNYWVVGRYKNSKCPELEQALSIICFTVSYGNMAKAFGMSDLHWMALLTLLSLTHSFLLLPGKRRPGPRSDAERVVSKGIGWAIAGTACVAAYVSGWFAPSYADMIHLSLILISCSAAAFILAFRSRDMTLTAAFAVFCNANLIYLIFLWSHGSGGLLASFLGVMLAAVFMVFGIRKDNKPFRRNGLIMAILYAVKISLLDTADVLDALPRAAILLLGVFVCVGAGIACNESEKKAGKQERLED